MCGNPEYAYTFFFVLHHKLKNIYCRNDSRVFAGQNDFTLYSDCSLTKNQKHSQFKQTKLDKLEIDNKITGQFWKKNFNIKEIIINNKKVIKFKLCRYLYKIKISKT